MERLGKYPREWLERIPAVVFGCLLRGELRITVFGGAPWNVSVNDIPFGLRMPNTLLWLKVDEKFKIIQVWRREPGEWESPSSSQDS
jgi:hypothetical protein